MKEFKSLAETLAKQDERLRKEMERIEAINDVLKIVQNEMLDWREDVKGSYDLEFIDKDYVDLIFPELGGVSTNILVEVEEIIIKAGGFHIVSFGEYNDYRILRLGFAETSKREEVDNRYEFDGKKFCAQFFKGALKQRKAVLEEWYEMETTLCELIERRQWESWSCEGGKTVMGFSAEKIRGEANSKITPAQFDFLNKRVQDADVPIKLMLTEHGYRLVVMCGGASDEIDNESVGGEINVDAQPVIW